jgi:hypothetical protein
MGLPVVYLQFWVCFGYLLVVPGIVCLSGEARSNSILQNVYIFACLARAESILIVLFTDMICSSCLVALVAVVLVVCIGISSI